MMQERGTAADAAISFLLRQGRGWDQDGQVYRAMSSYFDILQRYPDSQEASEAKDRLLEIARGFEEDGQTYRAMGLYDRLARVEEGTYSYIGTYGEY
ncbi:MAG: hypothetical protein ACE5JL_11260 [Dehalococcoidia bacterium]